MKDLIIEYRESLSKVQQAKKNYQGKQTEEEREQYRLLSRVESDLRRVIKWLETGREPGKRRGVERLAAYQREIPFDPIWIQSYYQDKKLETNQITESERKRIDQALSVLSPLEREVYLMSRGRGISFSEIAMMIGITRDAVAGKIRQAERKLVKFKQQQEAI